MFPIARDARGIEGRPAVLGRTAGTREEGEEMRVNG